MNRNKPAILIVDDDTAHRTMLKTLIASWGYDMYEADDGSEAISCVKQRAYDLVLMDIRMMKIGGLEALEQIKSFNPAIPVVIMTAYSSVETAINALKSGAYDYLIKPLDFTKLKITINRAMEHAVLKIENQSLRQSLASYFDRRNIVGNSPAIEKLLDTVAQVAPSEATILINGESGTGKELIAGAIHYNSHRKNGPFIKINCAAITETLLESELFGHEKGSFTGAERRKEGRFVQAAGGSLFLDEVSEMSLMMQVKLLRVLQERELTRVGGEQVIPIDVRVIAAANRVLPPLISEGRFREDLYYRLNVVNLTIPPLRERREDIPLLAQHFLEKFASLNRKVIRGFTPQTMDHLIRYDWPGNVRELMNTVERAVVLARSDFLDDRDLPILPSIPSKAVDIPAGHSHITRDMPLVEVEKAAILRTLESTGGNKSQAARLLGITRKTLHSKLISFGFITKG
ncbi:MAG TPA: sigma-54 dependent transcriptional regulator [Desulfatirhabdiaceae bacterium]|nr:sigma-54 dependent transcriptional regulator [Desulfatirhabdiaceae bacterium]